MIRTTISRIKRVWAITFSPRLLRGDLRYPPGKFQILTSTAPTTSLIRTKSNDSIYEGRKNRAKYGVADSHEEKDIFDDYMPQELKTGTKHGAPKLYKTTSACRCDECNKVIAEIFGEEPPPSQDDNIKRKVLNNIAQVNMTDNSGSDNIVSDNRIQAGLFNNFNKGDNDSLPEKKIPKDDVDSITMTKDSYRSVLCHEVVLMNNRRGNKPKPNDMDTHQMYTNLYDVDPEDYQLGCSHDDNYILSDKKLKEQNKDAYWNEVYETAVGENSVYCEPTLSIDTDTLNTYKALKSNITHAEVRDTSMGVRQMKHSPRELERILHERSLHANKTDAIGMIINAKKLDNQQLGKANTGDLNEDQLTQKIEHIEETPLVEAEKSKVERTHDTPKVLGYAKKATEINSLDEVAKRCLTSHHNQIDEILLKEMEKLGIPLTVQKSAYGLKMGDIQADAFNKLSKTTPDMATELDNREEDDTRPSFAETVKKSNNLQELKDLETKPLKLDNQYYFDLNRTRMVDDYRNKTQANSEPTTGTNVGNVGNENQFKWLYWRADNDGQPGSKRSGTSEQENTNFTDSIWQKNQLDPNHVLTCNETCSISPKPLTTTNYMNRIDGSEVMFHQQNVHGNEHMQKDPLLEGGGNAYTISSERNPSRNLQHATPLNYMNASKAEDFKDFINSTNSTMMPTGKQEPVTHAKDYLNLVGASHSEMTKKDNTREVSEDSEVTLELSNDIKNESNIIEATNEQLQATSEQLQAASIQLQATCVHLQTTTEKLQETTEQLQATSDNLLDSSDKLHAASGNLYTTSEKLQNTSEKLRDTSEQLGFDMQVLLNKISSYPTQAPKEKMWDTNEEPEHADEMYLGYAEKAPNKDNTTAMNDTSINSATPIINTSITASMNPNYKPEIKPCVTPATASIITETMNSLYRMKGYPTETKQSETKDDQDNETVKTDDEKKFIQEIPTKAIDPKIEGWTHQATAINPEPITRELPQIQPLPQLKDTVKLSELMRLVRERNRLVDCHDGTVLKKPIRKDIIPMARPMTQPPDFKVPGYPEIKPIPRICVPKRRPTTKSVKCSSCDTKTLGIDQQGPFIAKNDAEGPVVLKTNQPIDFTLIEEDYATDFTDEFILQLRSLGNELESSFQRGKTEILEAAVIAKTNHLAKIFRSNDYEPWSPIPSWPYPKKEVRQKVQCPKDGCKIPPPLCIEDRPCGLKPCKSFPTFPKRTFSLLDCYPVSLGDHKVVDVGQF